MARTTRELSIQLKATSSRMNSQVEPWLPPVFWLMIAISRKEGMTSIRSMIHRMDLSTLPPKKAADAPISAASSTCSVATEKPMISDLRSPSMVMAKTSRPPCVVPNQCRFEGGDRNHSLSTSS